MGTMRQDSGENLVERAERKDREECVCVGGGLLVKKRWEEKG